MWKYKARTPYDIQALRSVWERRPYHLRAWAQLASINVMQAFWEREVTETLSWEIQAYSQSSTVHSSAAEPEQINSANKTDRAKNEMGFFALIVLLIHIPVILSMKLTSKTMKTFVKY